MVCRSASTWQGWNSSESALTTGTVAVAAMAISRSCPNVRHTMASTIAGQHLCGVLQSLVAAQLGAATVDDDGVPAELRDAHLEGEPGAGGVLVEDDRDAARSLEEDDG